VLIEVWRFDYNLVRPHSALGAQTPDQFARPSLGARRLSPGRPDGGSQPETSSLLV